MIIDFDIGKLLYEAAIYAFIAIFIGLSQAAGIGGGPILNICLMIGMGYGTKDSMAITYIFLLGGCVASIYANYGKRNKENTKNLIDQNLVVITLPMTVAGSVTGALLNHLISQFIVTICFTVLLVYLAVNSYQKYNEFVEKQKQMALLSQQRESILVIEMQDMGEKKQSKGEFQERRMNSELERILTVQKKPFRFENMFLFCQVLIISILCLLMKGGQTFQSIVGFEQCGIGSQLCVIALIVIAYIYAKYILHKQYQSDNRKEELGYVFSKEEDKMSKKFFKTAVYGGFAAGCTGGMLGIGGAIILVPYWLEIGLDKDIATSSSAPLVFSSAFISMFIAAMCNMYTSVGQILFHFAIAFVASFYVKQMVNWIKNKFKMQGIVFLLLMIVMGMSVMFLLPFEIGKMLANPRAFFGFGNFC